MSKDAVRPGRIGKIALKRTNKMTIVLQKLLLKAYRGVSGLVLDNLTPVSLVVGANNSGKSSILEAAGLILRPPDLTQWANAVRHRAFDPPLVDGLLAMFADSTLDGSGSGDGSGDGSGGGHVRKRAIELVGELSGENRSVVVNCFGRDTQASARIEVSVDDAPPIPLKFSGPAVAHQVPMYRVFAVTPATHYSTKALVEHLSRVVDEGKKQLAVELLQVFDKDVEDLDVIASLGREAVLVTHRIRGVVDLASFGESMRRSAALAFALTRASQGVLLVDDIEAGIHHSLLRPVFSKILAAAATCQVQILATTHSLEAIDAIIEAVEQRGAADDLAAFWLRRKDGSHEVRRYAFDRLLLFREGGLDVR